ncbi:MAG TPA: lyase family protein [Solirubrobacter sp.]|nr:lyase family protein [Solirubrobacter sp.]
MAEQVSGRAWLQALLDFEAALARAQVGAGIIGAEDAERIAAVCDAARYDVAEIGAGAAEIGNPAGAVVKALQAAAPGAPVHLGATSQDAVDTAAMLVAKRALVPLLDDLRGAADAAAGLAREHRGTPIMGRTLLQAAKPTTFGLKAAGWMTGLDEAAAGLRRVRLASQTGGPVGTAVPLDLQQLGLEAPLLPWHTERTRIGELAGALGVAAGAAGKAALDVILLSQTEVAAVRERTGGGSTSMPHKHNPVAAISALGCAKQAPGLVATLLAAMVGEHERAAGAWQSEWKPLSDLLLLTGSAAAWLHEALDGLEVDAQRMRVDGDTGAAATLVDRALENR